LEQLHVHLGLLSSINSYLTVHFSAAESDVYNSSFELTGF